MSMAQASSEYFQRVANRWDAISAGYFGTAVRDAAIAKSYLRADMTVADIGAGTGFLAAGLAPLVRLVHVVDASPEMLAVARQNLNAFANVEYHQADGLSLPFADASLDAVFANMYLHHIPQPGDAIREMLRVLRPGGRLVMNFVTLENLASATATLDELQADWDVLQLQAARSKPILHMHRMAAENPVWLVCARQHDKEMT